MQPPMAANDARPKCSCPAPVHPSSERRWVLHINKSHESCPHVLNAHFLPGHKFLREKLVHFGPIFSPDEYHRYARSSPRSAAESPSSRATTHLKPLCPPGLTPPPVRDPAAAWVVSGQVRDDVSNASSCFELLEAAVPFDI